MAVLNYHNFDTLSFTTGTEGPNQFYSEPQTADGYESTHVRLDSSNPRIGTNCCRFEIVDGLYRDNYPLCRSEVRTRVHGGASGTVMEGWYSFSFKPGTTTTGQESAVISQLHKGSGSTTPCLSFQWRFSDNQVFFRRYNPSGTNDNFNLFIAEEGVWKDIDIWYISTTSSSGRIKIWVDGVLVVNHTGVTDNPGGTYDNENPYWKLGLYAASFGEGDLPNRVAYFDATSYHDNTNTESETLAWINNFRNPTPVPDPEPEPVPLPEYTKHPIALPNQYYLLPANAVSGDHLGEVNYLYTFCKFWNEYEGTSLTEDQFTFTKVGGSNNFVVNADTGMISVVNMVGVSSDTTITVRVAIGGMHVDVTCHIMYIPTTDCIFFDPTYTGANGTSNGTKERPYLKYEIATHNFGTAGKSYFFKRGTTIQDQECVLVNPVVGGQYPEYINVGSYGQGERPIFTDTGSGLRSFTLGNQPWGNSAEQPENAGNNIRIFDIEASRSVASSWYPILIKPVGDNIHINRFRGYNTLFENGLLYAAAMTNDVQGTRYRNILLENFEVGNGVDRVVKIETSGVRCFNFRCTNEGSFQGFPAPTCAHKPHVAFMFIDVEVENTSTGSLGFQARASNVVHKWIYAKGLRNVIVPFVHDANDGWGGDYIIDDTCIFENIIIDNCYRVGYFGRHSGTTDVVEGLQVNKIKVKSSELGFEISEGAKNVKVVYSDLSNCTAGAGYRIWSTGGIGAKLHNCTLFNNLNRDIYLQRDNVEIINCNYGLITNPSNATITTSSTSTNPDDLIGLGTDLGYSYDLEGNEVNNPPTIGSYELSAVPVEEFTITLVSSTGGIATGGGVYEEGDTATLEAIPDADYEFDGWSEGGSVVSTSNPWAFVVNIDRTITPVFTEVIPPPAEYTVTVIAGTGGAVSGGGVYEDGEQATVTATPDSGWHFVRWSNNVTDNPYTFTVTGDVTLQAIFAQDEPLPGVIIVKGKFRIV